MGKRKKTTEQILAERREKRMLERDPLRSRMGDVGGYRGVNAQARQVIKGKRK